MTSRGETESRQEYDIRLAAYQRGEIDRTGVMVHLVPNEDVDNGPVLRCREIHFMPDESLEQFVTRVHHVEHKLLVDTRKNLLEENKRRC